MPWKFLKRGAIVDVIKSQERTNAIQKRDGLSQRARTLHGMRLPGPELRRLAHDRDRQAGSNRR